MISYIHTYVINKLAIAKGGQVLPYPLKETSATVSYIYNASNNSKWMLRSVTLCIRIVKVHIFY